MNKSQLLTLRRITNRAQLITHHDGGLVFKVGKGPASGWITLEGTNSEHVAWYQSHKYLFITIGPKGAIKSCTTNIDRGYL
jgi:hypothetical protein